MVPLLLLLQDHSNPGKELKGFSQILLLGFGWKGVIEDENNCSHVNLLGSSYHVLTGRRGEFYTPPHAVSLNGREFAAAGIPS